VSGSSGKRLAIIGVVRAASSCPEVPAVAAPRNLAGAAVQRCVNHRNQMMSIGGDPPTHDDSNRQSHVSSATHGGESVAAEP
jgi:hypothetical protein